MTTTAWRPQAVLPPQWMDWVRAAGEGDLVALLESRPDLAFPPPRDLGELARRMVSVQSVSACYGSLDRTARQVLCACLVAGEPAPLVRVAALLGVDRRDLQPVVDRLARSAMVRSDGDLLHVAPSLAAAVPEPAGLGPPWRTLAAVHPVHALKQIAARLGLKPSNQPTKDHLLALIERHLLDGRRIASLLPSGPAGAEKLAHQAARHGNVAVPAGAYVGYAPSVDKPAGWLMAHGLIFPTSWGSATMAREVALALRGGPLFPDFSLHPPSAVTSPVDAATTDDSALEAARWVVARVTAMCEELGRAGARQLQSGGVGVREVRRVGKAIGEEPDVTARLMELGHAARLLVASPDDCVLPTRAYDDWAAKPFVDRWSALVEAWAGTPFHVSVAGAPDVKGKPFPPLARTYPEAGAATRRYLTLRILAQVPSGQAASLESVAQFALWAQPALWEGGPADGVTMVRWVMEEADLLGLARHGHLATWGRAVARGEVGEAASLLATRLPAAVDRALFQGDMTAVVAGEPSAELAAGLRLLADAESTGVAAVYRFSDASVRRAFDAGWDAARVRRWLDEHSGKALPQALAYLVDDVARRHGKLRAGGCSSYLRCEEAALLAEIVGGRRTASLSLRAVAPTVAVSDRPVGEVLDALRAAGYLPVAEDSAGVVVTPGPGGLRAAELDDEDVEDVEALGRLLEVLGDQPEVLARVLGLGPEATRMGGDDLLAVAARGETPEMEDPLSLARRLRAAPAAAPPVATGPRRLFTPSDECQRPAVIAKGRDRVEALLDHAADHEWTVRVSYTNAKGATRESNVDVLELGADHAHCTRWPDGSILSLHLGRVQWARVLTEAEEEAIW